MAEVFWIQCKKSAQDATTVTLVPDTVGGAGEKHPNHISFTQAVLTFTATDAAMFGAAAADGRKYRLKLEEYT